jgi:hypothetical protein
VHKGPTGHGYQILLFLEQLLLSWESMAFQLPYRTYTAPCSMALAFDNPLLRCDDDCAAH